MWQEEKKETTQWFYLAADNRLFLPSMASWRAPNVRQNITSTLTLTPPAPARHVRCLQPDIPVSVRGVNTGCVRVKAHKPSLWVTNKHIQDDYMIIRLFAFICLLKNTLSFRRFLSSSLPVYVLFFLVVPRLSAHTTCLSYFSFIWSNWNMKEPLPAWSWNQLMHVEDHL